MLDFSDDAIRSQLLEPGTYDGRLADVRQSGDERTFLTFTWELDVPERDQPAVVEELLCIGVRPGAGDPAQTALGIKRLRAILVAHALKPKFETHDALIGAIVGKHMRVVIGRGAKAGVPIAKISGLLPPTPLQAAAET